MATGITHAAAAKPGVRPTVAGDKSAETKKGEKREKTPIDTESRTKHRMEASLTGCGLKDWCFGASLLVKDCLDEIEGDSPALQKMLETVYSAAQVLNEDNWRRFNELVSDRVHCQDHEVHGALFAKVEPSWRPLLTTPKGGTVCVFLHIGTEPPSGPLIDLLTKLGWFGVSVSPIKMETGYEDLIESVQLDPSHDKDRDEFIRMMDKSGGKVPKPAQFMLAFVNTVFSPFDPEPDSDEELGAFAGDDQPAVAAPASGTLSPPAAAPASPVTAPVLAVTPPAGDCDKDSTASFGEASVGEGDGAAAQSPEAGVRPQSSAARPQSSCSMRPQSAASSVPSWVRAQNPQIPTGNEAVQCSTASGYGKLGVTRYASVRKRLRTLYTSLQVALNRLKHNGSLVLLWPGLPCHPVMFFLTSYLRNLFMRVHVVAMEGIKTFEIYILCATFNREKANDATPGEGGTALKSFLGCAYRRAALDDVLLWTLTANAESEEAFFGVGGKSKTRTYDELWTLMAAKYKALAVELDMDVTKVKKVDREKKVGKKCAEDDKDVKADPKAKGKSKAEPKSPAKAKAGAKGKAKAEAKAKAEPKSDAKAKPPTSKSDAEDESGGESPSPSPSPPQAKAKPSKAPSKAPDKTAKLSKTFPASAGGGAAGTDDEADASKTQKVDAGKKKGTAVSDALEEAAAQDVPKKPKPKRIILSRSVPCLATTFGAAPGSLGATLWHPDRQEMSAHSRLIKFAELCAEHKIDVRKWHRKRPELGVSLSGDDVSSAARLAAPPGPVAP